MTGTRDAGELQYVDDGRKHFMVARDSAIRTECISGKWGVKYSRLIAKIEGI